MSFTQLLNQDPIFSILFEYLNYIEKRVFRQLYQDQRPFDGIYKEVPFSEIVKSRLSKLIPDADIFLEQLAKAHGIISGSFILQCLYDQEWGGSDIDVYYMGFLDFNDRRERSNHGMTKFVGYLNHNYIRRNLVKYDFPDAYIQQYVVNNIYHLDDSRLGKDSRIMRLYPNQGYQLMVSLIKERCNHGYKGIINALELFDENKTPLSYEIKDKEGKCDITASILNYINKIFDFDFCKVAYDPSTKQLHILDFNAVFYMKCIIDRKFIIETRNTKDNKNPSEAEIKRLTDILDARIVKYRERGFDISEKI